MIKNTVFLMASLVGGLAFSNLSFANAPEGHCSVITGTLTWTTNNVTVSNADPVGTEYPLTTTDTGRHGMQCTPYSNGDASRAHISFNITFGYNLLIKSIGNGLYDIGVPGLALKMFSGAGQVTGTTIPDQPWGGIVYRQQPASSTYQGNGTPTTFRLVRVNGVIPSGNNRREVDLLTSIQKSITYNNLIMSSSHRLNDTNIGLDKIVINYSQAESTCSFQSDNVTFPLGDINASKFSGVGSFSEWVITGLRSAGCQNVNQVGMTFQAPADSDNGALFAVQGGAAGVGIELQSTTQSPAVPDNSTQMLWSPRDNGATYDFRARYVQTRGSITPGEANANIIVNMHYQ